MGVWPVVLVSGGSFAAMQFFWSNYVGPELVDIAGGLVSLTATAAFAAKWKPKKNWDFQSNSYTSGNGDDREMPSSYTNSSTTDPLSGRPPGFKRRIIIRAWMPWVILSVFVLIWGLPPTKALLTGGPPSLATYQATGKAGTNNPFLAPTFEIPSLHKLIYRTYPVEAITVDPTQLTDPAYKKEHAEAAIYTFNWLSATGTSILLASFVTAIYLKTGLRTLGVVAVRTLNSMKWPLFTIACMLALGYVTRYSGTDAILGLAFTRTGPIYPFFAPFVGWLGVALTGSDTSSNVLFGNLQKITAQQLALNPILIVTANSTGGVMGKMIDAQSIVVSTAATNQHGKEGTILRFVLWHSIALTCIVGVIVLLQAYIFTWMIPSA